MLREDIKDFLLTIPKDVTLVAATKYITALEMRQLYECGVSNFGENRVDSFLQKYEQLKDLNPQWHFIGHLQCNKAKNIINKINYLHSLDSLRLAKIINEQRLTPLKCFIEVNINGETNKNGVSIDEIDNFIQEVRKYPNIEIVGLMMMSVKDSDEASLIKQFQKTRLLKEQIERNYHISLPYLSMGMSDDYLYAIKEKATHIRLGRILYTNENK